MEQKERDLTRLCVRMHTKNELQTLRCAARVIEAKYTRAIEYKQGKRSDAYVSNKSKRLSISMLVILRREAHIANETCKLNIAKFTMANKKEMKQLRTRNSWKAIPFSSSSYYNRVWQINTLTKVYSCIIQDRNEIAHRAASQILEDAMVYTEADLPF